MHSIRKASQRGFTLIEAMAAGVVLSIITAGLMSTWTIAGTSVNDLVVREKAIWALNAQMERLVALYQFTEFGSTGIETSSGYGYSAGFSDERAIFGGNTDRSMAPPGTFDDFKLFVGQANSILELPNVFFDADGFPIAYFSSQLASERRNYVWVDRDRQIVGRLSWEEKKMAVFECDKSNQPGGSKACLCLGYADDATGGAFCREIALALEFPFRWDSTNNTVVPMPKTTEVISLRTIVGRR